jgi:hypothetical protein
MSHCLLSRIYYKLKVFTDIGAMKTNALDSRPPGSALLNYHNEVFVLVYDTPLWYS